jgi:hypothetical protein
MPTPDPDPVVVESARSSSALARAGWLCTPAPLDDKEIPITRHGDCDLVWRRPPIELSPPEIRAPKALRSDGSFTSTGRCPARASFCTLVPRDDCGKFEPTATSADRRGKNPPRDKPRWPRRGSPDPIGISGSPAPPFRAASEAAFAPWPRAPDESDPSRSHCQRGPRHRVLGTTTASVRRRVSPLLSPSSPDPWRRPQIVEEPLGAELRPAVGRILRSLSELSLSASSTG